MNYQDGYSQKALNALAKGKYKSLRSSEIANKRYTEGKKKRDNAVAKQNKKQNPTPRNTNAMANDPGFFAPSVSLPVPTLISAMQGDPRFQVQPEYNGDEVLNQLLGSVKSSVKESPNLSDMIPGNDKKVKSTKKEQKQTDKVAEIMGSFDPTTPVKVTKSDEDKKKRARAIQYQQNLADREQSYKYNPIAKGANTLDDKDLKFMDDVFENFGDEFAVQTLANSDKTKDWEQKYGKSFEQIYADYLADRRNRLIEQGEESPVSNWLYTVADKTLRVPFVAASDFLTKVISPDTATSKRADAIRHQVEDDIKLRRAGIKENTGDFGDKVLDTVTPVADRMVASNVDKLFGLGGVFTGLSDYSNQMEELNMRPDMTERQKALDAGQHGLVEGLGTAITMGILDKIPSVNGLWGNLLNVGKGAGNAAFENTISEIVEMGLDSLIADDNSQKELNKQIYMLQGMDEKQAEDAATMDQVKQAGTAAGTGALFGGTTTALTQAAKGIANAVPDLKTRLTNAVVDKAKSKKVEANDAARLARAEIEAEAQANANRVPDVVEQARAQAEIERLNEQLPKAPVNEVAANDTGIESNPRITERSPFPEKADGSRPDYHNVEEVGTRLETTRQAIAKNNEDIEVLNKQLNDIPDLKKNAKERSALKNQIYQLEQQNKQSAKLEKILTKISNGEKVSNKDIFEVEFPDDYHAIFDGRGGFFGRVNMATKFAGDTPEAKALAQSIRDDIYSIAKGDFDSENLGGLLEKVYNLDRMAQETKADYRARGTGKNPSRVYKYDDFFAGTKNGIGDDFTDYVIHSLDKAYQIANNMTDIDTTSRVAEAAGESAPIETPESVVAELNQTPVEVTNNTGIDNRVPTVTEGNVPPATGKEKVSEYRGSTMRNTGVNQDMEDAEFDKRFDKKNFTFESKEEQESVDQAKGLIKDNGEEGTSYIILNKENGSLKQYEIDAGQMLADKAERAALDLESQGKDATEEWNKAITLHKKLQSNGSVQAQGLQALKKWKNNTVWGLLDYVIADTRKAIDKKKTPGYSNMVNDLADEVEDAINKGKSPDDIINGIRKVFEGNRKKSPYKTTKLEQQVLSFVNDPKSKQKFASSLAEEAGRLIKKNMGVSTITTAQQKQMLDLFREACKYDEGSRSYNELVGRAMQLYDSTLPASLPSMVKSLLYDNMLFSPKTMMSRNFMGNVGEYGLEKASKPFQVGADVLTGLVTKDRTRTFSKNGIKEGAKGFVKGIKDWGLDIAHGVNTPRSGKQTVEDIFDANRKTFKTQSENKIIKGITKFLGGYDTFVRKGMELGDRIIYEPKFAATKAELYDVIDKFGDSGLRRGLPKGKDYSTEDLVNMIATKEALESVLQNDTLMKEGASHLKKALSKTSQEVLGFDVASMTISPFVEVPANKASRFLQFTPLGILGNAGKSIREKIQYGSVNQRRATGEAGRTAFGTLATAGMTALGSNLVSGAKSKDPEERKVQENNGYQEYAIQLPNGKQVDVTDMTALPGYAKKLREGYDEGGIPGLLRSMPGAIGKATLDSLYSGVNRLAGTSYSTNNQMGDTIPEKALNAILSSGNMLVPQTVRQTAQLIDPYKRDLGDYGTAEYNRNLVINGLPVLRQMLLDPKIDTSGNYVPELGGEKGVKRFFDAYLAPYKVSDPEAMKSERVLAADAIKEATNGEVKAYPDIIQKSDLNVKGYDMDNYSHKDLATLREEVYNRSDDLSTWVINQDWFKDIDPAYQGKILTSIDSASKALGLEDMVRKGKTEDEIAKSGEDLYSAGSSVKALTEILRKDDKNHTLLKEFLQKDAARQAINDEYDIKMSRKEYEAHEDDPTYAQDKVAATERDLKTATYRKVYDYASSTPNVSSDDLDKALPVLQGMGIKKQSGYYTYINAKSVVPNLTAEEFANTFNAIDKDGNNGIEKDEFAAWLTLKNPTLEQAQKYTDMYYTDTNKAGAKRKVKKADNGWTFYY